jgi:hypothetical protein
MQRKHNWKERVEKAKRSNPKQSVEWLGILPNVLHAICKRAHMLKQMGGLSPIRTALHLTRTYVSTSIEYSMKHRGPISQYPLLVLLNIHRYSTFSSICGWWTDTRLKMVTNSFRTIIFHVANEKAQHALRRVQFFWGRNFFWVLLLVLMCSPICSQ